jgi:hypothetical protein
MPRHFNAQHRTPVEIGGFVVTWPLVRLIFARFTYEERRGRESNPRIAVLQTAALPLGYPADLRSETAISPLEIASFEHQSL